MIPQLNNSFLTANGGANHIANNKDNATEPQFPERVLQFGTGVLLWGLPDYFIAKSNRDGLFNGRIVVIKSTESGSIAPFEKQDNLYTLHVNGITGGKEVREAVVISAISRVLSVTNQWHEILGLAIDS